MVEIPGNLFPRKLDGTMPTAVKAYDVWIEDGNGKKYLDASGGAIVVNVGHGRKEIAEAVFEQLHSHDYVHPTMMTSGVVERLAEKLAVHAPDEMSRFYFLSSGSEAVETAVKLARQIHTAAGRESRFQLISRWKSYHGLSMGALCAMGRTVFRAPYAPMLGMPVSHIPPPYCYRCSFGLTHPACDLRCANALSETIENLGPDTVSAFLAETVSGGTLAGYPPPPGYLERIRDICDRFGVLLILDEVLCGMGRTGSWFACDRYGAEPDIMTMGKGLSGGYVALSAVGVREAHFQLLKEKQGAFIHGGTYTHHPVAAAAGLAVIRILEEEKLVERVDRYGPKLGHHLRAALQDLPWVGDIRGVGFLWGVELVQDKTDRTPFPRKEKVTERIWDHLFENGVITYKSTGLAGTDGDAIIVAPIFTMKEALMKDVVGKLRQSITKILKHDITGG